MGVKSENRAAAGRRTMRVTTWRFMRVRRKAVEPAIIRRNLTRRLLSGVGIAALLTGASLALLPAPARADTSWTGTADDDWNNAGNWSNGLPVNASGTTKIAGPVAATVDGISVTDSGRTNIGSATDDGSLIVEGGGTLNVGVFELFGYNGYSGTATIRGAGSGITASSSTFIGSYSGIGHIFIEDGGTLTTPYTTYMSQYDGSLGTVTVTGSGSTWNTNGTINLGAYSGSYNGTGILTIADGGLVNITSLYNKLYVAGGANSTGTLNIGAAEGDAAAAAGSLQANNVAFGAGDGTIVFNHTEPDYTFAPSVSGNGDVHQIAGTTILSGSNTWSGSTVVDGGTLRAGSATGLSNYSGYEVNGGTLDLNDFDLTATELSGTGGTVDLGTAELEVDQDSDSVFDGLIAGAGSLVKLGSGILSLTGANTFSGGTTLGEGTLRLEDDDAIGTGALTVTGGTLDYDDGIDLSNDIDLRAEATLNVTTGSATQSGNIGETGGSFGIVKSGAGTLELTGTNGYTGGTTVEAGTLRAGSATGLSSGAYEVNGGTLDLNDFDLAATGLSGTGGTVDLGSAELETDQDSDSAFDGLIAGTGSLVKLGSGILSLTGANTFSGGTTLGEGTLRLEDDDAIGTGALTATGGTLDYDDGIDLSNDIDLRANTNLNVTTGAATQSGNIGETGGSFGIVKTGAGTLSLTGTNSYTGGTTVSAGTLKGNTSSLVGDIVNNAALAFDQASDGSYTGALSGTGTLEKTGAGILTLSGTNSHTGGTTVSAGTLRAGSASAFASDGTYTVNGGTLDLNDFDLTMSALSGTGGTVDLGSAELEVDQDSDSVFDGIVAGAGSLVKLGTGILSLTGANSYSGGTTVEAGTLRAGSATGLSSGAYEVNGGTLDLNDFDLAATGLSGTGGTVDLGSAELEVDQDSDSAFDGLIAGTGSLVKLGSGILSLTGANTFSGGTTLGEGTLRLEDDDAIGTGALTATGGTLDYDDGIDLSNDIDLRANTNLNVTTGAATQSGNIGETGGSFGIVKTGAGALSLTGTSSFTGGIAVNEGRLIGNTASLVGDIDIVDGAVEFQQSAAGTFTGAITGSGTLVKAGEGETVFSGSGIDADYFYIRGEGAVLDGGTIDIANRIEVSNALESGETTDASLTIRGGANVTSGEGRIGDIDNFEAAVTVSGAGSTWTIGEVADPTYFRVAGEGAASLLVEEGAEVEVVGSAYVYSMNDGPASSVAVTGENSLFDVSGLLDVGGEGTGELTVSDGGSVRSGSARVGRQSPRTGIVTITGAGSEWLVDGSPFVLGGDADGLPGAGHLTLADGGLLQLEGGTGTLHAALGDGSTARINIGAAEGADAAAAGTLDLGTIVFDDDGVGDGRLLFNHTATDYLFGALLEGAGTVSHIAGVTTFTGLSTAFTGVTSLTGGQLNVDGTLGGSMSVSNARLGGSGTVGNTTLNGGGVLSPGNSIGTLTVDGDLAFGDGSFFEVELNDGGTVAGTNNDFVDVTGGVTIDSGASVFVAAANGTDDGTTYAPNATYTLIAADNGVSGIFGAIGTSFAFLAPTLSYDANNVFLSFVPAADFEDAAVSPNQQAVAAALDALGAGNEIYDALLLMTEEEARHTFDTLTGEAHASTVSAFFLGAQQVREVLTNRLAALFGGPGGIASRDIGYAPAAGDATPHAVTVWGQVFGGWGTTDATASTAPLDRSSAGFLGGVDREVGTASRIGIAAGYSRSTFDVNGLASSGESDNFHIAGYAGTELGEVEVKAALAYSYQMADTERTVLGSRIKGDYGAHTIQGSTEASMGFDMGDFTLTPFAGLSFVHIETESFTETGGPAALAISGTSNTTGITALGLRARRQWETVDLFGSLAWRHAFGDIDPVSRAAFASNPAAPFTIRGAALSEDVLALGAGVEIELGTASVLELSYEGEFGEDARDHGLKAEISFRF